MPIYTCTYTRGSLPAEVKARLASAVTAIHAEINNIPPDYVNVVFSELPQEDVFVGGRPGSPLLISGWARRGHPQESTTRLAQTLSDTASEVTGIPSERVLVVILDSPARSAVEAGRVLPDPGEESAWLGED
ncbi:tautomerase family protein [Streptomyces tendae]|uniref:tautomerase family protein n=1 Tax=Streptomyces tendae TaxID=1932 RepID=UPI00384A4727